MVCLPLANHPISATRLKRYLRGPPCPKSRSRQPPNLGNETETYSQGGDKHQRGSRQPPNLGNETETHGRGVHPRISPPRQPPNLGNETETTTAPAWASETRVLANHPISATRLKRVMIDIYNGVIFLANHPISATRLKHHTSARNRGGWCSPTTQSRQRD